MSYNIKIIVEFKCPLPSVPRLGIYGSLLDVKWTIPTIAPHLVFNQITIQRLKLGNRET